MVFGLEGGFRGWVQFKFSLGNFFKISFTQLDNLIPLLIFPHYPKIFFFVLLFDGLIQWPWCR